MSCNILEIRHTIARLARARNFLFPVLLTGMTTGIAKADEAVSWHREVLPILRANCASCHKPEKAKGGLDLTSHAGLMKGGKEGAVVRPGEPGGSALVVSVSGEEPDMPKEGVPLAASEVAILSRWPRAMRSSCTNPTGAGSRRGFRVIRRGWSR
jgi:hypothetical protein